MKKVRETIIIAIFVSLAGEVKFNFITDGFIVAVSALVMAIFIYCYEDLSARYIAFCVAIFSPLLRLAVVMSQGVAVETALMQVTPDVVFFFSYGILYPFIYDHVIQGSKTLRNFPYVVFLCDFFSNVMELLFRSLMQGTNLITLTVLVYLLLIAIVRTAVMQMILLAVESYSNLLVRDEHNKEYRKLIDQASIFESELHVMKKNVTEIEDIMKKAYTLYQEMCETNLSKNLKDASLEIAKNAHEIKGDYLNIISVLQDSFIANLDEGGMSIRDIISIERANLQSLIKRRGLKVEVIIHLKTDFYVQHYFKMMSVIRNLILNAAEAMEETGGKVVLTLWEEGERYHLDVGDNGPGIKPEKLETIFYEGFSTKFSPQTGNVQRGLGLTLVKDYVENEFQGTIQADSEEGKYTEFHLSFPKKIFEEREAL